MLSFFEKIPNSIKILLLVIFISIGVGMFGREFIDKSGIYSLTQAEQKNKDTAEEITVRLQIRNRINKVPIPDVMVDFERLGVPVPTAYTDNAGYIDIKIPKVEYVKVYLSKPGFQSVNYQIELNNKDRNPIYWMSELSSPSPDSQEGSSSSTVQKEFSSSSPQENNSNFGTEADRADVDLSKEIEGFQFNFQSCLQDDDRIVCKMQITSLEKDTPLLMQGGNYTRIFDYSGNEYTAKGTQIGSKKGLSHTYAELIKNVPINASIIFSEVPSRLSKIKALEIKFLCQGKVFKVQYDNITVSK